ncbi:MAG: hypothetical protein KDK62_07220 [Chlamydiia bacterium]|nr:hypothetical protein [Chlamydiia bacterium]
MDYVSLIITLVSGAIGGNIAAGVSKEHSLGTLGNAIVGAVGGGAGNWIAQAIGIVGAAAAAANGAEGFNVEHLLGNIASSGIGGAILTLVVGLIKNSSSK